MKGNAILVTAERPVTTKDGRRLRFHSAEAGKLAWKSFDEMSVAEKAQVRTEYPSFAAEFEGTGEAGRYANEIEYFESRIAALTEVARSGQTPSDRFKARAAVQQYRKGIEVLREAETIPEGTRSWFAVVPGELTAFVPPHFGTGSLEIEYPNVTLIRTVDHIYDTDDPIRIAWMRKLLREPDQNNNYRLYETEHGQYPMLDDHGMLIGFVNRDVFTNNEAARSARTTVDI